MKDNWYDQVFRKMHFDLHTPGEVEGLGRDFDGARFAQQLRSAHVEAICFFAKSAYGWSHYPTSLGAPHPHLERDLLGEAVAACHAVGIRLLAYYCIEVLPPPLAEAHPEWLARRADGSPHLEAGRALACVNSSVQDELILPQLREIVGRYEVDGVFFDGYPALHFICHCPACQELFGRPLPAGPEDPQWNAYHRWQRARLHGWCTETAEAIHQVRPEALVGVNWLACNRYAEPVPAGIDYLTADYPVSDNCALGTSYQLAGWSWRDWPCDVMNARMLHWWQDWTCRPLEALKTETAAALARGGRLFWGDLLPIESAMPDPDVLELARATFEFSLPREELARGATPVADVALVNSVAAHLALSRGPSIDETPLRGAFLALVEGSWTAEILLDVDLAEHLRRYQTVVLPGLSLLEDEAVAVVRDFVAAGGGLVVCADVGSEETIRALAEVLGVVPVTGPAYDRAYVRVPEERAADLWPAWEEVRPKVLVLGTPLLVEVTSAESLCPLIAPGPSYQLGARPPAEATPYPALTLHRFGQGRAAFAALPLARDFWARGNSGAKHLLNGLVNLVTPHPTVQVEAPEAVEVTLAQRGPDLIVHLLSYHAGRRPGLPPAVERTAPLQDLKVRLRCPFDPSEVQQEPEGRPLDWRWEEDSLSIRVPRMHLHTAVVVRGKP
jgi:hypothetical protein